MFIRTFINRFLRSGSGIAAVEFGMIAPVIAAGFVFSLDLANNIVNRMRMEAAVRAGVQYLMEDGRDIAALEELVKVSWTPLPVDADVSAERYCLCSDVAHACNTLCGDNSAPESYFTVSVSGTSQGIISDTILASEEQVRVR
jgi:Flp pilus assembly protein TadG